MKEKHLGVRTKLSYCIVFQRISINNRNEKKTEILMNKPVYLALLLLELSKILMYGFWYDYVKPKYGEKAKLCFMDKGGFIVCIKTDNIYKDITDDVETRFDTSNYELDRPLPKEKNEKLIRLMKDELNGKVMIKFIELRTKSSIYLIDDGSEDKKAKITKKCAIKIKTKFENYRNCLESTQIENKMNYLEKNKTDINSIKKIIKYL